MGIPRWLSGKGSICNAGDAGLTPGLEDPLKKETATHYNISVWKIPYTEGPGGLQSMGWQEWDTTEGLNNKNSYFILIANTRFLDQGSDQYLLIASNKAVFPGSISLLGDVIRAGVHSAWTEGSTTQEGSPAILTHQAYIGTASQRPASPLQKKRETCAL